MDDEDMPTRHPKPEGRPLRGQSQIENPLALKALLTHSTCDA